MRDRVIAMGLDLERFDETLGAGRFWVGGEPVTDPSQSGSVAGVGPLRPS